MEGEVGDMEVEVEAMAVEAMEVEATEVEGDQEGTIAMEEERAEKVMHCSLAAASVARFVGSCSKEISVRKFQCVQYLHRSLVEGVLHLESKLLC